MWKTRSTSTVNPSIQTTSTAGPPGQRRGGLPGQRIEIFLNDCPPFQGDNELELAPATATDREHAPSMEKLVVLVNK